VVFEDAPAGIEAARASGARVIALTTTYDLSELASADGYIETLAQVSAEVQRDGIVVLRTT
jgi:mannitol-1-/sugar-/sorbitol-6-phosphatase